MTALVLVAFGLAPGAATAAPKPQTKSNPGAPNARVKQYKTDGEVTKRSQADPRGTTSVIVTLVGGGQVPPPFRKFARGGKLDIINGQVLELPNGLLKQLEAQPEVFRIHHNRPAGKENYRTAVTVGARAVHQRLGYTGAGIGVAVIDSGVAAWHDDLTQGAGATIYPYGNQRVVKFVDFVNGQSQPYDDNGHGSHVAGIVAGNGYDSRGEKAGIAPDASLVALKVLDANGVGTIGHIIAALNWVAANHQAYNIRVVNLSVGAKIRESYWTDPLTLAAKAVADQGIVVVGASGNFGKNAAGQLQYGGIAAPGNAPWVLTVGASSTEGSLTRRDDIMAAYSSSGPTFIDFSAKPDLVAPGTGTVSLAVPGSTFYQTKAAYLVNGNPLLGHQPYLTLSGTSMAAPVVSGTVALMLEANPGLTPNLVKAILQYTAEAYPGYDALRQGAGFLNTLGAVRLAEFYARNEAGARLPVQKIWSQHIIWGNYQLTGGYLNPRGNAWASQIVWGSAQALNGDNIVWGTVCGSGCDNIVWGTHDRNGDNIVWGTSWADNIVWGTGLGDNIVWGTGLGDNIVWGTGLGDNIVWGTGLGDNIVWGTGFGDNIVWGTGFGDNIVWGTDCGGANCDNVVWGTAGLGDNIVWGTAGLGDNIVWGTAGGDNIVWGTSWADNIVWGTASDADATWGSSGEDHVAFVEDELTEPPLDVALEFGDVPSSDLTPTLDPVVTTDLAPPTSDLATVDWAAPPSTSEMSGVPAAF